MTYIMSCVWLDYMVKYFQCKNCVGSSPKTKKCVASFLVPGDTSEQSKLCSVFLCMKNIRLQTADVFIPFRERLYFIRRNIAIRNDNIIFL